MNESDTRILLVDDENGIREQIKFALADHHWSIDEFGDVESASSAIRLLREAGSEYDAAILDLRLPKSPNDLGTPVDETLCGLVRDKTLVWHISAYFGDQAVQDHLAKWHSPDEQFAMLEKIPGYTGRLESQMKRALANRRVKAALDLLEFGPGDAGYSRRFRPDSEQVSVTNVLAGLCNDIKHHWNDLTPALQCRINEHLDVVRDSDMAVQNVFLR
jgi:CheY-like chemotaxis protein